MNSACPRRVSLITAKGTAVHSVSNHRRNDRGSPGCQRIYSRPDRLRRSLADSPIHTDRIEFTATSHPGTPVLRTGRSRCVALHPGLLRRSYGSIPHGSSPHRGGLSPPYPLALSGARARPSRSHPAASRQRNPTAVWLTPSGTRSAQRQCLGWIAAARRKSKGSFGTATKPPRTWIGWLVDRLVFQMPLVSVSFCLNRLSVPSPVRVATIIFRADARGP